MISRDEYERVISTFIVELNHIVLRTRAEMGLKDSFKPTPLRGPA